MGISAEVKEAVAKMEVPPMGKDFEFYLPQQLVNQLNFAYNGVSEQVEAFKENHTEAEAAALKKNLRPAMMEATMELADKYYAAREEVEKDVEVVKSFFRSQSEDRYKTKADVL